jgi:autotransporter-associated beta strand protein
MKTSPVLRLDSFKRLSFTAAVIFGLALGLQTTRAQTAANFTITNHATGQPLSLYNYQGSIILLDFWAYWCGPCGAAASDIEPNLTQYYRNAGGNSNGVPVQVISISIDLSDPAGENSYIQAHGLELVGDDGTGVAFAPYDTGYIPQFVVINGTTNSVNDTSWEILTQQTGYLTNDTVPLLKSYIDAVQTPPPLVTVTNPANGAVVVPAGVALGAGIASHGKIIKKVAFYNGTTLLGSTTNTPYSLTWSNAPTGAQSVFARAYYGATSSADSAAVNFTVGPPVPPTAPAGLSATAGNQQATLSWAPVPSATGYFLRRGASSGHETNTVAANYPGTNYTDSGLVNGTTYYYMVAATNTYGASTNSLEVSITPVAPPPPAAPAGLTATAGNLQVALAWAPVSGATGYFLRRGTGSGHETNTVAANYPGTNYTDTGLVNGTTYYYVVATTNTCGAGTNSLEVSATPAGPSVSWIGTQSGAWNNTVYNWVNNGAYALYADGDNVLFNDSCYNSTVVIGGPVAPGIVTFANASVSYTLSATSGGITGAASLVKTNAGTLNLASANTYTGGTFVSGGALLVNNPSGSATGAGTVTVTGGTLAGAGSMAGPVAVNSGGILAPGNPLGTLTLSNNLTLAAGGTLLFQVQHSPLTNNSVLVFGTLTQGGALVVTNSGGVALAKGDSFKLFSAGTNTGAFASLVLPALPAGLGWNTNTVGANGTLSVVVTTHPVISAVSLSKSGLVFQGSGGSTAGNYYLLGSTNLAAPMTNWTRLLTNQFDNNGNFNFTNLLKANAPPGFFRLQVP